MTNSDNHLLKIFRNFNPRSIGQINLLLEILSRSPKSRAIIIRSMLQMAAKSDQIPQPELLISLAEDLGIVQEQEGELNLSRLGKRMLAIASWPPQDCLNEKQLNLISPEIIGRPEITKQIFSVLGFMTRTENGDRSYLLGSTVLNYKQSIAMQILQLTKFAIVSQGFFIIDNCNYIELDNLLGGEVTKSEEELWESLKRTALRSRKAEEYIVSYERKRLIRANRKDLSELVERVGEYNAIAPFDIISFEADGTTRYIEVKSSTSLFVQFYWTINERLFAEQHRQNYWIYFIPRAHELPTLKHDLVLINDPVNFYNTSLKYEPSAYKVWLEQSMENLPSTNIGGVTAKILKKDNDLCNQKQK